MTISDGKIAGAVIAAVVILMCCFLKNGKICRKRPRLQSGETPENESSLERHQAPDPLNGHIPLPGFRFDSTLPVKFCTKDRLCVAPFGVNHVQGWTMHVGELIA